MFLSWHTACYTKGRTQKNTKNQTKGGMNYEKMVGPNSGIRTNQTRN